MKLPRSTKIFLVSGALTVLLSVVSKDVRISIQSSDAFSLEAEAVDATKNFPSGPARVGGRDLPDLAQLRKRKTTLPVPGGIGAGVLYPTGKLAVATRAQLDTEMIVRPEGLDVPNWLFTTATNRTEKTVEVVGIYIGDDSSIGVFDWSCSVASPCPNKATGPSWQWTRPLSGLECYRTSKNDGGGHLRPMLRYKNNAHITRFIQKRGLSEPQWANSVFFQNYCSGQWDRVYYHAFTGVQRDCSQNNECGWWGPILETFMDDPQPLIKEVGFANAILYYDSSVSKFDMSETAWTLNDSWQVFHKKENRTWGAGGALK